MKITDDRFWNLAILLAIAVCVTLEAMGVKL